MKIGTTNHFSIAALTVLIILIVCQDTQAFEPWKNSRNFSFGRADPGDQSHESITEQAYNELQIYRQRDVLEEIVLANGNTDYDELISDVAHFDDASFRGSQLRLQRLVNTIRSCMSASNLSGARRALGQALHTVQDFYSHSNWVE